MNQTTSVSQVPAQKGRGSGAPSELRKTITMLEEFCEIPLMSTDADKLKKQFGRFLDAYRIEQDQIKREDEAVFKWLQVISGGRLLANVRALLEEKPGDEIGNAEKVRKRSLLRRRGWPA